MKIQLSLTLALLFVLLTPPIFCEPGSSSSPAIKTFVKRVSGGGALVQAIQGGNDTYISLSQKGKQGFLVRKTRSTGEKVWERTLQFDGTYLIITLEGIAQTSDGGYILAGWGGVCDDFYCYGLATEGVLVKLGSNGSIAWKRVYAPVNSAFTFTSVVSSSDGGFIATGSANGHLELVKFTSTGDVIWIKTLTDSEAGDYQLVPTFDSGYVLVSEKLNGAHVIKLNNSGTIVWTKSLQLEGFAFQTALVTSDHGVVLAFACGDCDQASLVRLQQDGTVGWKATYSVSLPRGNRYVITDLMETSDSGYVISAATVSYANSSLLKIDSSKKVVFSTTTAGARFYSSIFNSPDGGLLIFGYSMLISRVDSKGTAAGCNNSSLPASKLPQTPLKTGRPRISEIPDSLLLGVKDIVVTSTATNLPLITICQ